jgi:hypothetical protein
MYLSPQESPGYFLKLDPHHIFTNSLLTIVQSAVSLRVRLHIYFLSLKAFYLLIAEEDWRCTSSRSVTHKHTHTYTPHTHTHTHTHTQTHHTHTHTQT